MGKLKKREIIILIIAAAFVLYAAYVYLIADKGKKQTATGGGKATMENLASTMGDELSKDQLNETVEHTIRLTTKEWSKNPFLKKDLYRLWATRAGSPASGDAAKIIYSGYVDSGRNKFAVLNGVEYRVGEQLEIDGYVLKEVTPSRVVIYNKNTGDNLEIPLQE